MKTAISFPDPLFAEANRLAKRLRLSRSKLFAVALEKFLREQQGKDITKRLNEVYARERSDLDPVLQALQYRSLPREEW